MAFTRRTILIVNVIIKPAYQKYTSFPVAVFALPKQDAKATSNKPAMIKIIQFIFAIIFVQSSELLSRFLFTNVKNGIYLISERIRLKVTCVMPK